MPAGETTPDPVSRAGLVDSIGKWIAVCGAVIGAGQAGTSLISGYWHAESEKQQASQALALADIKERSGLASEYLKLIIAKDTTLAEQVTLLDALASIDHHPLQQWAKARYAVYEKLQAAREAAFQAQRKAAEAKEGLTRDEATLQAEIETLNADRQLPENAPRRDEFESKIVAKSGELSQVRARLSIAQVRYDDSQTTVSLTSVTGAVTNVTANVNGKHLINLTTVPGGLADEIAQISQKISADQLNKYFPSSAAKNVEVAAPFLQAAFQEFRVSDKWLAAAIIATVVVETPKFEAYEEPAGNAEGYQGKYGNINPGDGVKYRGRGYLGLTGRANYEAMSKRLGLGSRLIDSPEDAKSPEVATRTLVAWFVDRRDRIGPALMANDLGGARAIVSGSRTRDIEPFTKVYRQVLADL